MSKTREDFINSIRVDVPNTPIMAPDGTPNTSMPEEHDEQVQELEMTEPEQQENEQEAFLPGFDEQNQ